MIYRKMCQEDIESAASLYIEYFNSKEDGQWTQATASKRIHQVLTREDSFCLVMEDDCRILGFAMGYFEQFDDGFVYNLVEIVLETPSQRKGLGTAFMRELEAQVKRKGAIVMILNGVNDDFHEHFYTKLGFRTASNLVIKTKVLTS